MALTLADAVVYFKGDSSELDSSIDKSKGKVGGLVSGLGKLAGGAVLGAAAGAAAAIGAVGVAAFNVSNDTATAAADIAASLGIPIAEAERFADVAREVYGNNFADSVGDAAEAVGELAKQMGLSADDPALKTMTENAFRLRDTFDIDVSDSIDAAKTLIDEFGLSGQEAFDLIAAGNQKGLNRSGDFLDTIGEYSTQFANAGFDAEEFFGILESGSQGGVLGTDKIADAVKEMGIILNEGSDDAKVAFETIGLDFDQIAASVASGDETWAEYFPNIIAGLQSLDDPIEKSKAQVALFGTMAEDLGTDFTDSFSISKHEMELFGETITAVSLDTTTKFSDMEGAASSLDAKYETFGAAVDAIWRKLVVSISPFTDKLLELVNDAMPKVMGAFDQFDAKVGPVMNNIESVIRTVVDAVKGFFEGFATSVDEDATGPLTYWKEWADTNLPLIRDLFDQILGAIKGFWDLFGTDIMTVVDNTLGSLWTAFDTALRTIGDLVTLFLQVLTGDWEGAKTTLEGIVQRLWEAIKTIFTNQLDSIETAVTMVDWAGIGQSIIDGIANGIRNRASKIKEAAENAARSAYDAAKRWLGISSPSKKFEELGEFSAEGYEEGIKANISGLAGSVTGGLSNLVGGMQPQPLGAGATYNINVNLSGKASYEDGRMVGRGVLDELRSRGQ